MPLHAPRDCDYGKHGHVMRIRTDAYMHFYGCACIYLRLLFHDSMRIWWIQHVRAWPVSRANKGARIEQLLVSAAQGVRSLGRSFAWAIGAPSRGVRVGQTFQVASFQNITRFITASPQPIYLGSSPSSLVPADLWPEPFLSSAVVCSILRT